MNKTQAETNINSIIQGRKYLFNDIVHLLHHYKNWTIKDLIKEFDKEIKAALILSLNYQKKKEKDNKRDTEIKFKKLE